MLVMTMAELQATLYKTVGMGLKKTMVQMYK